jgi:inhibitor of cysteine peptidase
MKPTTMDVELGKEFHIDVESNPSTGYVWEPVYEKEFLDLIGEEFERRSNAIGSGGILELSFVPLKTGKTQVILQLMRPWEKRPEETREFKIEIF